MQGKLSIWTAVLVSLLSLGWVFNASFAQDSASAAGRYQHTAVFRQEGLDRVYVTVLDTSTGEVVRLLRYDTGDYASAKPTGR
ncbi:MAG TPA: hypothetical protein VLD39_13540 [Gammaproteobacteria bacterium]|nr:hypothetical protein [Gammaproteobacteria bacterium]